MAIVTDMPRGRRHAGLALDGRNMALNHPRNWMPNMMNSSLPFRRTLCVALTTMVSMLSADFHRPAMAQGIGATGKQRVLVIPIQRAESVSSVIPGRVDEYVRSLLQMSGKVEVVGLSGLVDKPVEPKPVAVQTDKFLLKADETLWKGKEAAEKGKWGEAIKLFKRSAKLYEKRFDKLVDFDKYIDASLGISLGYFLAGYEDNGEDALAPVVVMRPDLILDKRRVPKTAIAALERLTKLYAGGTKGKVEVLSKPPGAEVYVDGNYKGKTPYTLSGQHRGRHVIRLVQPGHQPWAKAFTAGSRDQRIKARLKPVAKPAASGPSAIKVSPDALIAAVVNGQAHRGFARVAKPITERYNLDAVVALYMRRTPERFEMAPFLYDRASNRVAELDWIPLNHGLTDMQVNLIVLDEKLNAALANFPMSQVARRKSKIYEVIKAPKPPPPPKPKPRTTLTLPPTPAPKVRPRPKPAPVAKPAPRPTRTYTPPKARPVPTPEPRRRPAPPRPAAARPPVQPTPAPAPPQVSIDVRLDDGLGGNLGRYMYPDDPIAAVARPEPTPEPVRAYEPPPPPPVVAPSYDYGEDSASAWYKEWWVWTIVGAAVAGGATTAIILGTGGAGDEYGGTIQW